MTSGDFIQSWIHKLEHGAGSRYLRILALAVIVLAIGFCYDFFAARDFSTPEAMDSAQLARNISDGKGYTTLFIRPFSLYLMQIHNQAKTGGSLADTNLDLGQLKTAHPDLANAPVYPVVLAGLMKLMPASYFNADVKKSFWSDGGSFLRYRPEFFIGVFNEILLLAAVWLTFVLARNLFDANVAWLSAVLVLGCEEFWQFSMAGLSTIFLMVIFLALALCLFWLERDAREPQPRLNRLVRLSIFAGALVGIGALTRYSFGWAIIPVTLFLIFFGGQRRWLQIVATAGAFLIVLTPWIVRNEMVSGTLFGTAGYAWMEATPVFPQFQLERSIHPELSHAMALPLYFHKLEGNAREIFSNQLPKLGGSWASLMFLAGLLLGFRGAGAQRIRYFLLMCLGIFIVAQALGQTQLSEETPVINSENLLALLAPVVFIYGASFFFTLLEQMTLPILQLRYVIIVVFAGLCCLPMILTLLVCTFVSHVSPRQYPPYYPPKIQQVANYMNPDELMMSDVPWAVAWYGNRQCVWLTLDWQNDFSAVSSLKTIQGLYLTPQTMDGKFVSEWMEGNEHGWGRFLFQVLDEKRVPGKFPLTHGPDGFFPEQMFLSDHDRWSVAR